MHGLDFKDSMYRAIYEEFLDHLKVLKHGSERVKIAMKCKAIAREGL